MLGSHCGHANFTRFPKFCAVGADLTKSFETCKMAYFVADSFELNRESSESIEEDVAESDGR